MLWLRCVPDCTNGKEGVMASVQVMVILILVVIIIILS